MIFVEPKVIHVAGVQLDNSGVKEYLDWLGVDEWSTDTDDPASELVEIGGRLCYRSFQVGLNANVSRIREGNKPYTANILNSRHGSVVEHTFDSYIYTDVSRIFTHECTRHRVGTAFCLAGDTQLYFDLPSGSTLSTRRLYTLTLENLYRKWAEGATVKFTRNRKSEGIISDKYYTAKELSKLVGQRRESINTLVRLNYLKGEKRIDENFTRFGNKYRTYIKGSDWIEFANKQISITQDIKWRIKGMKLRMCNEETGEIEYTSINNITYSGVKLVYRFTLNNGYSIKMTLDHNVLTENGWMSARDWCNFFNVDNNLFTWTTKGVKTSVNGEYQLNIAGNKRGVSLTNEGRTRLRRRERKPARLVRTWSDLKSIEYIGEESTYDIEVTGPFNNFVANGFIVHNSQESLRFVRITELRHWFPTTFAEHEEHEWLKQQAQEIYEYLENKQILFANKLNLDQIKDFNVKKKLTSAMRRYAPEGLATSILHSANVRTWRWLIESRTSIHAEEEIRLVFYNVYKNQMERHPNLYQDVIITINDTNIPEIGFKNSKI